MSVLELLSWYMASLRLTPSLSPSYCLNIDIMAKVKGIICIHKKKAQRISEMLKLSTRAEASSCSQIFFFKVKKTKFYISKPLLISLDIPLSSKHSWLNIYVSSFWFMRFRQQLLTFCYSGDDITLCHNLPLPPPPHTPLSSSFHLPDWVLSPVLLNYHSVIPLLWPYEYHLLSNQVGTKISRIVFPLLYNFFPPGATEC